MFYNKYILANELCDYLKINKSNISMARKDCEESNDLKTFIKLNGTVIVDLNSSNLKSWFKLSKEDIKKANFTSLRNILPVSFLETEHELSKIDLLKIGGQKTQRNKTDFWVFEDDFVKQVSHPTKNTITYILDDNETKDCLRRGLIEGYIPLTKETAKKKSRNLVWYFASYFKCFESENLALNQICEFLDSGRTLRDLKLGE